MRGVRSSCGGGRSTAVGDAGWCAAGLLMRGQCLEWRSSVEGALVAAS